MLEVWTIATDDPVACVSVSRSVFLTSVVLQRRTRTAELIEVLLVLETL